MPHRFLLLVTLVFLLGYGFVPSGGPPVPPMASLRLLVGTGLFGSQGHSAAPATQRPTKTPRLTKTPRPTKTITPTPTSTTTDLPTWTRTAIPTKPHTWTPTPTPTQPDT